MLFWSSLVHSRTLTGFVYDVESIWKEELSLSRVTGLANIA